MQLNELTLNLPALRHITCAGGDLAITEVAGVGFAGFREFDFD